MQANSLLGNVLDLLVGREGGKEGEREGEVEENVSMKYIYLYQFFIYIRCKAGRGFASSSFVPFPSALDFANEINTKIT